MDVNLFLKLYAGPVPEESDTLPRSHFIDTWIYFQQDLGKYLLFYDTKNFNLLGHKILFDENTICFDVSRDASKYAVLLEEDKDISTCFQIYEFGCTESVNESEEYSSEDSEMEAVYIISDNAPDEDENISHSDSNSDGYSDIIYERDDSYV
ncbi:hypothetical protein HZS_1538 [Henneguya salminicola]|nr:hypothetical protein HZS_1538 [Henneguya salminicola]